MEAALTPHKRGRPATPRDPKALPIAELEPSSPHLRHQLRQAQAIIEVQKSVGAARDPAKRAGDRREGPMPRARGGRYRILAQEDVVRQRRNVRRPSDCSRRLAS